MVYAARRVDAPIGAPPRRKRPEITDLCSGVFDLRVEDARRIATFDTPELGTDCDETATHGRNRRWARRFLIRVLAGVGVNRLEFAAVSVKSIHHDNQA
jgi:hypothetical protein